MNLEETIFKRQSIRNYKEDSLTNDEISELRKFIENVKVLNEDILWSYDIITKDDIKTILNWKAPHYLLIFSEEKENYLENVGFIFQQVDLFLQSKGIGSCWIGMASPKSYKNRDSNQKFIITISFGKTEKNIGRELSEFKRNKLSQISDMEDEKLIPAQLAPSATNSQPWYFTHNGDGSYNIYRKKFNILKRRFTEKWNRIDIGIALAHLYVTNDDTFEFSIEGNHKELDGYYYEGSFTL